MEKGGREVEQRAGMQVHEAHVGEGDGFTIMSGAAERCIQVRPTNVNSVL